MNLEDLKKEECIICLESIDDKQIFNIDIFPKDCEHKNNFHLECINKWIEDCINKHIIPSCPLCRNNLNEIIYNIPEEVIPQLNRHVINIDNNIVNNINNINKICRVCQITCGITVSIIILFAMFAPYMI